MRSKDIIAAAIFTLFGGRMVMAETRSYVPEILEVKEGSVESTISDLESQGVVIYYHRGNLLLASVPEAMYESGRRKQAGAGWENVIRREKGRQVIPALKYARASCMGDEVHSGSGLQRGFTGKGIVVGMCDIGFDPMHIEFLDADGHSRVRRVVQYEELSGKRTVIEGDEALKAWGTDTEEETHATHVCGILAGGWKGNEYYGAAPDAEIVGTVSQCSDVGLLAGAEDIVRYAREQGKPAVVNMSMGNYLGPRDGTSLFSRYLDMLGEEAIVCMSAGNEGNSLVTLSGEFSESMPVISAAVMSTDWVQFNMRGSVEAWSYESDPIKARLICVDGDTNTEEFALPWVDSAQDFSTLINAGDYPEMSSRFTGMLLMEGGKSELNDRYWIRACFATNTTAQASAGSWARYTWKLELSGEPGTRAYANCDRAYTTFRKGSAGTLGSQLSVSDLACGDNVICVGMYTSSNTIPKIIGGSYTEPYYEVGKLVPESGYGTLPDGRVLPHTVGPGAMVVSAINTVAFKPGDTTYDEYVCIREEVNGVSYNWWSDCGTSMSTPFVAGYIATWLEADPSLKVSDVKGILESTNDHKNTNGIDPREGGGWFRPYEGVKEVLARSLGTGVHIGDVEDGQRLEWRGGTLTVYMLDARRAEIGIYSVDGRLVESHQLEGGKVHEIRPACGPGVYVARTDSGRVLKFRVL